METKKKLKLKKSILFKSISLVVVAISIVMFLLLVHLNIFPFKYLLLAFVLLFFIDIALYFLMSRKNYRVRILGTILSILLVVGFSIAIHYQNVTLDFLESIRFLNIQTETYYVIVPSTKGYSSLKDLDGKKISYVNDREGIQKAFKNVEETVNIKKVVSQDNSELVNNILKNNVEAILMEQAEYEMYREMDNDFKENTKIIDSIDVQVEKEDITKDVIITKESFSFYITGIDTYGALTSVSRSDVNMVVTVNPNTHRILLTSIPRDYYVPVAGSTSLLNDKLTHTGLKGVETSVKTIENLLETDINYYVRINFTSLVEMIDAIDGVDVENPFEFTADYEEEEEHVYYVFQKGTIHLDGKQALAYVRERYGLREGDIARARHQQQVISGVINKLSSTTILTKYPQILGSIEGNFTTNMSLSNITGFLEWQLDTMSSWSIESMVLTGSDASMKTASMPDLYSSVMIPSEESVESAIAKINEVADED